MASKRNTKKSSNTRKKKIDQKTQRRMKEEGAMQDEIILVFTLVISILLFLSNLNLSGKAGKFVSDIVFGMIGVEAFLLPFVVFFVTAFHLSNPGSKRAGRKIISVFVFLIALAAFIELVTNGYVESLKIFDYYTNSSNNRNGGGIIGGILVMLFAGLFDTVATYIILIAIMIISMIVITGKAILTQLARVGKSTMEERIEYQRLKREQKEAEEPEEKKVKSFRRPPKTFILDEELSANTSTVMPSEEEKTLQSNRKEARKKKSKGKDIDDLPILDLNHIFDQKESSPISNDSNLVMGDADTIPSYEDELRNKFGSGVDAVGANINPLEGDKPADYSGEVSEHIPSKMGSTGVEHEEVVVERMGHVSKSKSSTDAEELNINQVSNEKEYIFPPVNLLAYPKSRSSRGAAATERNVKETAMKLQNTLESFGVHVTITNVSCGPAVTRYELQPEQGVKVSSITRLADDIKLNLAAADIRIEAPIPGKAAVGIEVPNKENSMVSFRELIESRDFTGHASNIAFAVGKDIGGQIVITDIAKMPHLLIAGATGSGKSVCINTLIMSILYKANPNDVRLIMIDPKVVELSVYNGIPHLLIPVVTDPKKASAALNWAVAEMTDRYKKFAEVGVRDIKGYNEKIKEAEYLNDENYQKLPQIVIIIDELADLMMVAPGEVEDAICRLAQMARAAGLHLIIATQRPSVNVITGLIKANIPSRVAFAVSSQVDSRTIIDSSGAEKLLGKGDMLFFPSGYPKPIRVQGAFVSDKEVSSVVDFLKNNNTEAQYNEEVHEKISNAKINEGGAANNNDRDEYFVEAGRFIIEKDKASIGMLQRVYKIGFNRAARIMDQLSEVGVVGPEEGTKPRKVLMTMEQYEQFLEENQLT